MKSMTENCILAGVGIVKRYPGVVALDGVDFEIRPGEVHGLIGENGAGKSTLMKILAGIVQPDAGVIRLDGEPVQLSSPRIANDRGIAIVHQELNLVPYLSVADNIYLGRETVTKLGLIRTGEQIRSCREWLSQLDSSIDPRSTVGRLPVGQQQVVEIAKAISGKARVIFMDEPTSALSHAEIDSLFRQIRSLRAFGTSVVYVSHKLDELLSITDRITVLRDGTRVQTVPTAQSTRDSIVKLMVGRKLDELYVYSSPGHNRRERLRVESITYRKSPSSRPVVDAVTLAVSSGEVLGIFGLMGAGRTELLESIYGLHSPYVTGTLVMDGEVCCIRTPQQAIHHGLGLVPEDRKRQGLIPSASVAKNISLANLRDLTWNGWISSRREHHLAQQAVEQFSIKTPSVGQSVKTLSGGNQQKVVLSKVLSRRPKVLMLDEPTRGIDVSAKREIYALIDQLKKQGMAMIVVSSELPELLGIADRIMVMCEGRRTAEFHRSEATEENVMQAAVPATSNLHTPST
jgi:ribose transport system ATP-binding protein